MKKSLIAATIALLCGSAHAESFFQTEIGLGITKSRDMGDGIWKQDHVAYNHEQMRSPAIVLGLTGTVWSSGHFDARYHLDYTYYGQQSASCSCVSDADYAAHRYSASQSNFNGFGHVQGISLTFEPGYTYRGFRLGAEVGPWVYIATWHETRSGGGLPPVNANHHTVPEVGFVAGLSLAYGNTSIRYRYYQVKQAWNPFPGMVTGTHMINVTYRF